MHLSMVTDEEVMTNLKKKYQNDALRANLNINKNLWIDYKIFCEELSRKSKYKKISMSSRITLSMIRDILENKKSN